MVSASRAIYTKIDNTETETDLSQIVSWWEWTQEILKGIEFLFMTSLYCTYVWFGKFGTRKQPTLNFLITATNCQLTNYLSSLIPPVIQIPEPLFFVHRFLTKDSIKHMFLHMSPKKSWTCAFWGERVFAPFSEQVGYAIRIAIDVAFFCFSSVHQIKWYFFWMVRPGSDSLEPVYWKHELGVG